MVDVGKGFFGLFYKYRNFRGSMVYFDVKIIDVILQYVWASCSSTILSAIYVLCTWFYEYISAHCIYFGLLHFNDYK